MPIKPGRQRRRKQKGNDREYLAGDAKVVGDELGAGGHEASRHLGNEQPEQSKERVDVDIAGHEAQQGRHQPRQRNLGGRCGFRHECLRPPDRAFIDDARYGGRISRCPGFRA